MTENVDRRVIIVGIGGVGGILADLMVKILAFREPGAIMILVDGDFYESKNRERQDVTGYGNKAAVKAASIGVHYPEVFVAPMPKWVVPELPELEESETKVAVAELIRDGDIVFSTVDNFAARALIFNYAEILDNIDVFTGGNDEAMAGSTYHYCRREGKNVTDPPREWHPELENPPDRNPGQLSCQERIEIEGGTQFVVTNAAVAAVLASRYQHCIIDGKMDSEAEIHFDLGMARMLPHERRVEASEEVTVPVLVESTK